jgi:hypothetical protein
MITIRELIEDLEEIALQIGDQASVILSADEEGNDIHYIHGAGTQWMIINIDREMQCLDESDLADYTEEGYEPTQVAEVW